MNASHCGTLSGRVISGAAVIVLSAIVILATGAFETLHAQNRSTAQTGIEGRIPYAVATDGDYAVVGAPWHDGYRGAAYVLRRDGDRWAVQQRLSPADLGRYDHFGSAVSIRGDYIVVGATWHDLFRGAAYVFKLVNGTWVEQQKLAASDAAPEGEFGKTVSVEGGVIAVARGSRDAVGKTTYRFSRSGDRWNESERSAEPISDAAMPQNEGSLPNSAVLSGLLASGTLGADAEPPALPAAPPAPVGFVRVTNGTLEDRVLVQWSSVGLDAIVYKVLRDGQLISIVASDDSLFADATGELNATYSYCVVVKDMANQESIPVCADGRRIIFAPTSVAASDGRFVDRVSITWVDISKIENGYYVYRDGARIDSTGANGSWVDDTTGLPGNVYNYEVRAFAGGEQSVAVSDGGWRGEILPPLDVSASDGRYIDRVVITWQDQTDAELGYRIYRDSVLIDSTGVDAEIYEDSTVVFGTAYDYCVAAIGPGTVESARICDEGSTGLAAPGNVSASDSTFDDRIKVTWDDLSPYEDGYEISRALATDTIVLDTTRANAKVYDDYTAVPNTTYTYFVRAITDMGGVSVAVSDDGFRIVVLAPVNIEATDGAFEDHVDITWESHSTTAVLFKIYRDDLFIKSLSVGNSAYRDYGGTANRVYDYTVVAATALESENAGVPDQGSRDLRAPGAAAASDKEYEDKIVISWTDNSQLEHGYAVTRKDTSAVDDDTTFVIGPNRTAFTDYNAVPGVTYSYRVAAFDSVSGVLGYSEPAEDLGLRVLLPPSKVQAGDAKFEEKVEIFWKDNSNAEDGYRIYRDDVFIGETADNFTTFVDTSPDLGKTHVYSVAAYDSVFPAKMGESERNSDIGSTTILAPVSFNASDVYEDRIELAWVDVSGVETGFVILRDFGPSTSTDTLALTGPNVTAYTDHPPKQGTEYRYCIRAFRGSSLISDETCDDGSRPKAIGTTPIALSKKLRRSDPAAADHYGASVGVGRGVAIVGSDLDDDKGTDSGSAYLFERGPDGTWILKQKVTAGDGAASDKFGFSAAIDEHVTIVGAPGDDAKRGAAYLFATGPDGTWAQKQKLIASDGASSDEFGASVAVSGDYAIVGAAGDDSKKGAAYVFKKQDNGSWMFDRKLTASGGAAMDHFGFSVALDEETALIGAYGEESARGAAYIFSRRNNSWTQEYKLMATDGASNDSLGWSVALSGDVAIVGAIGDDSERGSVHVFQRQPDSTWVEEQRLVASDIAIRDQFGAALALRGGEALIGSHYDNSAAGSAYIFERGVDGRWTQKQKLAAIDSYAYSYFGQVVSIGVDAMLIGSYGNSSEGWFSGAAYLLESPSPPAAVSASDGSFDGKVRVTWNDVSSIENGYHVYRDDQPIQDVPASVEVYEDYDAEPGRTHKYSVAAFKSESQASFSLERISDFGWRPPNGNITGRISSLGGGASEDIFVGLDPLPTKALLLDGAGGHVRVADPEGDFNFTIDDDYTIEAWFRYAGNGGSGGRDGTLIAKVSPRGSGSKKYPFWLSNMRVENYPGRLGFSLSDGIKTVGVSSLSADLNDNTWHHVACVHDAADDELKIYIDGDLEGVTPYTGLGDIANPDSLSLGSGATTESWFGGQLDEIRIWNVARDSTQIRESMYDQLTGEEVGIVAYWPLDEGSSGVITDPYSATHYGVFSGGVYWTDNSAPLDIFAKTGESGTYVLPDLQYGKKTTFKVRPFEGNRQFEPPFTLITLSTDQPVQNQVNFSDISSYTLSGMVKYAGTDCPSSNVQIYVDGQMKGATDKNGKFAVSVDNGSHSIKPSMEGHSFVPGSLAFAVEDDIEGLAFADLTTRVLSGTVGGGCGRRIGDVAITVHSENGCLTRSIIADSAYSLSLPPQPYLVSAAVVESSISEGLIKSDVIRFFQNLGERQAALDTSDVVMDMTYRAPLTVSIEGFEAYIPDCPGPLKFEGVELPENLPVIPQLDVLYLSIHVDEDYGIEGLCPLESGTVVIYDEISDREGTPIELEVLNGEALYTTFACTPSLIVGRTDSEGNNRSFQNLISATAYVEGRTPATGDEWALVTGHVAEEGADFITATTYEPLYILRDPPGDQSFAYLEKGHSLRENINYDNYLLSTQGGIQVKAELGVTLKFFYGFGAGKIENIGWYYRSENSWLAGEMQYRESRLDVTVTTKERLSTSPGELFIGKQNDVFVGAGVNYFFSEVEYVEVTECEVLRSRGIGFEPDSFLTMYAYTQRYIEDALIPELQSKVAYYESVNPDGAGKYRAMRDEWIKTLALNDSLKLAAKLSDAGNRSFSGGTEYSYSHEVNSTEAHTSMKAFIFDSRMEAAGFGFDFSATGNWQINFPVVVHHENVTDYTDTTGTVTRSIGYVLSDDNIGDHFAVDIKEDGRYPSLVFDVLAGASSCPYEAWPDSTGEPRVMSRDKPAIFISPPDGRYEVPPDELATFTLTLANLSPTGEPRRYVLREIASANPYGAQLRANGVFINDDLVYSPDPGQSLELTVTVERGPTRYTYENLGLMVYPLCEWWIFEDGGPLNLADTVYFDVTFERPCSDITLFRPESGWVVSENDSIVDLILTDYEMEVGDKVLQAVGCEYRRLGVGNVGPTDWDTLFVTTPDPILETYHQWHPAASLLDGVYELRAYASCSGGSSYSGVTTGTIDRHGPLVLGTPEPADEDLSFGEDIAIKFNEPINCASIADSCVTLTWLDGANAGSHVALETVCDGSTIVIVPTADASLLEGRRLEASVSGIRDGVGNVMQGTASWAFNYRKSRFAWSDGNPSEEVPFRNPGVVTAELVNGTGTPIDFAITGMPAWIASASPASGAIKSGEKAVITFDILEAIAIGSYADSIFAEGIAGEDTSSAGMFLTLGVSCFQPQWSVKPSDFEHTMTMVAELDIGGATSTDTNDRVAAFVGKQLRGVANVQSVTGLPSTHLAFITVYGNRTQGETVRFQVWDDSDCRLYNATLESHPFVANGQIGSPQAPVTLTATDAPDIGDNLLAIDVDAGWNWFSTNIMSPDMSVEGVTADLTPAPGDIVKSQSNFSQFVSDTTGWVPSLVLNNVSSYMIRLSSAGTIFHSGTTVPVDSTIPVGQGWNWIGYLPAGPIELAEALGDLDTKGIVGTNDIIKSQDGFAQYYGSSWYGSLDSMRTGEGYKLYIGAAGEHTFNYPAYVGSPSPPARIAAKADERKTIEGAPAWSVNPRNYQYNMTVTSVLRIDGAESTDPDDIVGAFVGNECRGVASPVYVDGIGRYVVFLMIHSNAAEGEGVTFRAFDADAALVYEIEESIACKADAVEGTVLDPLILDAGSAQEEECDLPTAFGLAQNFPNPFNPATVIHYDVPSGGGVVTIRIYDVGGRLVRTLVNGAETPGRKSVVWNGEDNRGTGIAAGVYFYRMTAPGFEKTCKMVLLK